MRPAGGEMQRSQQVYRRLRGALRGRPDQGSWGRKCGILMGVFVLCISRQMKSHALPAQCWNLT